MFQNLDWLEMVLPNLDWLGMAMLMPLAATAAALQLWLLYRWRFRLRDDSADLKGALERWSAAAFLARPNPREMKRFLLRLRFAASGTDLPADTLVGLAVVAHHKRALVEDLADERTDGIGLSAQTDGEAFVMAYVHASAPEADRQAFRPTPDDAAKFLAAWSGITVRT